MIELCCEYLSVWCIWRYVIIMLCTKFRVNPHSIVCLNVRELLAWSRRYIWSLSDSNEIRTHNQLVCKRTLNHLSKLAKWLSCVVSTYQCGVFDCVIIMSGMSFRVNLHSIVCLNVNELLAHSRHHIWSLSDSNEIPTHNHLVCKRTLNHLAKLAKWLSCVVSTYLYGALDCVLLPCHLRVSEWIRPL